MLYSFRVDNNEMFETKYKASRRSFHLDVPHTEEKDEQNENYDDDDDIDNAGDYIVDNHDNIYVLQDSHSSLRTKTL